MQYFNFKFKLMSMERWVHRRCPQNNMELATKAPYSDIPSMTKHLLILHSDFLSDRQRCPSKCQTLTTKLGG